MDLRDVDGDLLFAADHVDLADLDVAALRVVVPAEHRLVPAAGRGEHFVDDVALHFGDAGRRDPVDGAVEDDDVVGALVIRRLARVLDAAEDIGRGTVPRRELGLVFGCQRVRSARACLLRRETLRKARREESACQERRG